MEPQVIIEKLKSSIAGRKIIAAVFYTFNFDARFFENYLLPIFLPDVNFSEIEIQNRILWRRYARELPPLTVYCDFHAKSNDAPSLAYDIKAIDLKTKNGKKPCFHPKNTFILLEDWSLLVMTGSNNLSVGGWCTNVEGVSLIEMKNDNYFPYLLKSEIRQFITGLRFANEMEPTQAEQLLEQFLNQRKHTDKADHRFYNSITKKFDALFSELLKENNEQPFKRIEIISPYFSKKTELINGTIPFSEGHKLFVLTPFNATNYVDITKETYDNFENEGVVWSRLLHTDDDKVFRFNHSKIYRLKGETKMYTIIGSANYSNAGWRGYKQDGNIESAIIYIEDVSIWKNWLVEYNNPDIQFAQQNGDEASFEQRFDVPDLSFTLDWFNRKLIYTNLKRANFKGIIMLPGKNHEFVTGKNIEIQLNESQINSLADNSIIKVHEYGTLREFYFFPFNLNIESKPYSSKLKLNDRELIELWQQVSAKEQDKNEIGDLLERYISSRLDKEGELLDKKTISKSTLNMMASHINALIKLSERLFTIPQKVKEYEKSKELIDYYLFTNNIDTIVGYRNLLKEMLKEKAILPGVAWFLFNLLAYDCYNLAKISRTYKQLNGSTVGLKAKVENVRLEIQNEMKPLKKAINADKINKNLFDWVLAQIKE